MRRKREPYTYLPKDFADYSSANVAKHMNQGYSLGPMLLLQKPDPEAKDLPGLDLGVDSVQRKEQEPCQKAAWGGDPAERD